jgi:hypothetical protein
LSVVPTLIRTHLKVRSGVAESERHVCDGLYVVVGWMGAVRVEVRMRRVLGVCAGVLCIYMYVNTDLVLSITPCDITHYGMATSPSSTIFQIRGLQNSFYRCTRPGSPERNQSINRRGRLFEAASELFASCSHMHSMSACSLASLSACRASVAANVAWPGLVAVDVRRQSPPRVIC